MRRSALFVASLATVAALLPSAAAAQPRAVFVELVQGDLLVPVHAILRGRGAESRLAEVLEQQTEAWSFRPAEGAGDFPRLTIALDEVAGDYLFVVRLLSRPGEPAPEWREVFQTSAEIDRRRSGGGQGPDLEPEVLAARFRKVLEGGVEPGGRTIPAWAGKQEEAEGVLFRSLRERVPVATAAHLSVDDVARAAIGVSVEQPDPLAASTFRIEGRKPGVGIVEVVAEADGRCFPWPSPPPDHALGIFLSTIRVPGQAARTVTRGDLLGVEPVRVMLHRYQGRDGLSCGVGASPIEFPETPP